MDNVAAVHSFPGYSSLTIWAIVLCIVFPFLATLCVIARFWTRVSFKIPLRLDDWAILAALALTIATCSAAIWAAVDGQVGRQNDETTISEMIQWEKAKYFLQIFHKAAVPMVKLSLLVFYNRIFTTRVFRYTSYAIGLYTLFWFIGFEFATIFQCSPISANWDVDNTHPGVCVDQQVMLEWSASTNVFGDIFILLMPWPALLRLQMPKKRKYGLLCLFLLGVFTCVASIAHTVYVVLLGEPVGIDNPTHFMGYLVIWFSIEPCVGVICACLPTFGPLIARQIPLSRLTTAIKEYLRTPFSRNSHSSRNLQRRTVTPPKYQSNPASPACEGPFAKLSEEEDGGSPTVAEHIYLADLKVEKGFVDHNGDVEKGLVTTTTEY